MTVHKLMLVAGGLVAILALALVAWLFLRPVPEVVTETPEDPFAPTLGGNAEVPQQTLDITLADGTVVPVPDFTDEQPAWASAETGYQVAGSEEGAYQILYFEDGSGFLISLFEEPLKDARLMAEAELKAKLRLSEGELCRLSVDVAVAQSLNQVYAGRNLGLSFCPGAVALP